MNKFALLVASLFVSVASFAQWTKPTAPAVAPMAVGEELYLYNKEADGFLVGANDWGTRASVSPTLGHKVYIENGTADGSYYITNYVLQGGMANQIGYMFIEGVDAIWVDNTKDGKANNQYTFEAQGGGTYKIGLSEKNAEYTPNDYIGAYLGLIPSKGDTRIYICDPENSAGYTMDECQLIWYFVAPAAYTTYSEAMKQYLAAVALGESIDEAVALGGVNADVLSAAQAAYANTSSTPEDMEAKKKALDAAIFEAKLAIATVDNPVDVLLPLGIASDFNDSDFTGWKSTTGASNKQASNGNNAKDYSVTGNHYENWNWDAFSIGKVSATATGLPTGIYHLNTLAYTTTVGGTFLYAGGNQKMVTATQIDIEKPMDIYAVVTDGTLEFGLDVQEKGTNWIGLDNVHLYYLGNAAEAYEVLVSETLGAEPDYETQLSKEAIYCQVSVYETYKTAVDALRSAKTADEVAQALSTFNAASKAMAQSVAAYQAFANKFNEADAWLNSTTSESDEVNLLADYLMDESAAEGDYNGHGGALYVLAEGLLDNAQIADAIQYKAGASSTDTVNGVTLTGAESKGVKASMEGGGAVQREDEVEPFAQGKVEPGHVAGAVSVTSHRRGAEEIARRCEAAAHFRKQDRRVERALAVVRGYREDASPPERLAAAKHHAPDTWAWAHEVLRGQFGHSLSRYAHADSERTRYLGELRQHLPLAIVACQDGLTKSVGHLVREV